MLLKLLKKMFLGSKKSVYKGEVKLMRAINGTDNLIHKFECGGNLLDGITIMHAAPVLAGIKPSSLFCVPKRPDKYREWAKELLLAGLRIYPLHACQKNISILLYNPRQLAEILADKNSQTVLSGCGYPDTYDIKLLLSHLKDRYIHYKNGKCAYPHEVGIFLGYPFDDVLDFITKTKPCRMSRYWKVYNSVSYAKSVAKSYDMAREAVLADYLQGKSLSQIALAVK